MDCTATYGYPSVFVEDDLQQMRRENRWGLKLLLLFVNIGVLMIRPRRGAGEI